MELAEYDALADVRGVGRDVLEKRIAVLVARAKELEADNAYLRSTTPGVVPPTSLNGPVGPSGA